MAPFEALYGRPCRSPSCWLESGEKLILGPESIRESSEKIHLIRERMKEAQSRQKSYANNRRRPLEFSMGDLVYIRASPLKGVIRFSQTGKLAPRYIGPFPITERIGPVAYRVALPDQFSGVHDVFHVSQLRKCLRDSDSVLDSRALEKLEVAPDLSFMQHSMRVLASETRRLRNKSVSLVKIQ